MEIVLGWVLGAMTFEANRQIGTPDFGRHLIDSGSVLSIRLNGGR